MTIEELRHEIFVYLKEKLSVELVKREDGNITIRIFLDGELLDMDYTL